jgi:hypothetical protein
MLSKDDLAPWLKELESGIEECGSLEAQPRIRGRYAAICPKLVVLTPKALERLEYQTRAIGVQEALMHVSRPKRLLSDMEWVLALSLRAGRGRSVSDEEWWRVYVLADECRSEGPAAQAAIWASRRPFEATATFWALYQAALAAERAETADSEAWAALRQASTGWETTARSDAWDRMLDKMLALWEAQ